MITLSHYRTIPGPIKSRIEVTWVTRFTEWAGNQNENKLAWLGIVLGVHGCFLTPLTAMTVMLTTYNFVLFMTAIGAMALALVTNLAALPTRITIPVFFLTIAIDIVIIATSVVSTF